MTPLQDLYAPSAPGSLMRSVKIDSPGRFRVARRDCELYSVQILSAGAWGRMAVFDAAGERKFLMPSMFTGSFWLSAGCQGGMVVEVDARDAAPSLSINWREQTPEMV